MGILNIKPDRIDKFCDMVEMALDSKARTTSIFTTDAIGQSMYPALRGGDSIVVDASKIDELKAGDIIAFGKGQLLVCHRIVAVKERDGKRYFTTKGDAFDRPDNFEVAAHEVAGKVIKIIKRPISFYYLFYLKKSGRAVLKFFGIYDLSKELFYKIIKNRIKYHVSIPRTSDTHPAYRFITLPVGSILDGRKQFYAPASSAGIFKAIAVLGKRKIATAEFYKPCGKDNTQYTWTAVLSMPQIFLHTSLEADLWETGRAVLEEIGFGLGHKPRIKVRPGHPFLPSFRWILLSLQGTAAYRRLAKRLFYRHVKFLSKEDRIGSSRFMATWWKVTVGSVSLVERKDEAGTSDWWIYGLQVSILLRGLGVGEELMHRLVDSARAKGARTLRLTVRYDRKSAVRLYKKMGFVKVAIDRHGMLLMEKGFV